MHNVRIENLTEGAVVSKGRQFIENRKNRNGEETAVITISKKTSNDIFVTAISWSLPDETPNVVSYDRKSGMIKVGKHKIDIRK